MERWKTVAKAMLVIVVPVTGLWFAEARRTTNELRTGNRLPEIVLDSANDMVLPSFENGLPKALIIVSASCPFCREQLKRSQFLAKEWKGKIDVLAISSSDRPATMSLLGETMYDEPVAIAQREETWKQWHVKAVPTTILLDPRMLIVNTWKGVIDAGEEHTMYERLSQTVVRFAQ